MMTVPTGSGRVVHRPVVRLLLLTFVCALSTLVIACGEDDAGVAGGGSSSSTATTESAATASPTRADSGEAMLPTPVMDGSPEPFDATPVFDEETDFASLTLEEARAQTPFEIIVPETVPHGLQFIGAEIQDEPDSPEVALFYGSVDSSEPLPAIAIVESTTPFTESEGFRAEDIHSESIIMVGDTEVTQYLIHQGVCQQLALYAWQQQDIHVGVTAILGEDPALAREFVAAILGSDVPHTGQPTPTAPSEMPQPNALGDICNLTVEQARELASFPLTVPSDVPEPFEIRAVHLVRSATPNMGMISPDATPQADDGANPEQLVMELAVSGASIGTRVTVYAGQPITIFGGDFPGPIGETLTIEGVEVRRLAFDDSHSSTELRPATPVASPQSSTEAGSPTSSNFSSAMYFWTIDDVEYMAQASVHPDKAGELTLDHLNELVASFITASSIPTNP